MHAGKDLFAQIQQNLFVSDNGIAETLCCHSQQFTETLLVLQENVWPQCIADDIIRLATEFQNLIDHFEERFHRFHQANDLCDLRDIYKVITDTCYIKFSVYIPHMGERGQNDVLFWNPSTHLNLQCFASGLKNI